ncbi:cysteine proteinase inhibitor 8-like [Miscanthus floridulus]|uniref:cysteine proteinase inhibitor 8-like n=1 Tax=Miscanthus floridulus TaxID=154761 RepID=UPI003458CA88
MLIVVAAAVAGLCSVAPAASASEEPQIVGGWKSIKNVNDPHIQELGRWAVSEYDTAASDSLVFSKVVSGEEQVVAGTNYKLIIEATKGAGKNATYGAAVYEKEWTKTRQLLSFAPAN